MYPMPTIGSVITYAFPSIYEQTKGSYYERLLASRDIILLEYRDTDLFNSLFKFVTQLLENSKCIQ
jgi:hypothetical protein